MSAKIADIADAIVSRLNAGSYGVTFTATRSFDPTFSLADLDTLRVTVVPKDWSGVPLARRLQQNTHAIDVGVQKRVDPSDNAAIDELLAACEAMADDFLGATELAGAADCNVVSVGMLPVFAPDHLRDKRVFTSVLTITVRETRRRGG